MPTATLNPNAPSPWDVGWFITGAATAWEALADSSTSTYIYYSVDGDSNAVLFESLPVAADAITSVTLWANVGQESSGTNTAMLGVVAVGSNELQSTPFTPSDGSQTPVSFVAATDGDGLPWTVARVNATGGLIRNVDMLGYNTICEKMWLEVVYTTAGGSDPPLPYAEIKFPYAGATTTAIPGVPKIAFPGTETREIRFPDTED